MVSFIDEHRGIHEVEPICAQLQIVPSVYHEAKARQAHPERLPPRLRRDAWLSAEIRRVHADHHGVYGARKVWRQLKREGIDVARCTVERLMKCLGIQGIQRGRFRRTTIADAFAVRPQHRVNRQFTAARPDQL